MPSCAAINCSRKDNKESRQQGYTFHRFPHSEPARLERWLVNMKRDQYYPSPKAVLCSAHFKADCFYRHGSIIVLNPDTVPTEFDFPKNLQKKYVPLRTPRKKLIAATEIQPTNSSPQIEGQQELDTNNGTTEEQPLTVPLPSGASNGTKELEWTCAFKSQSGKQFIDEEPTATNPDPVSADRYDHYGNKSKRKTPRYRSNPPPKMSKKSATPTLPTSQVYEVDQGTVSSTDIDPQNADGSATVSFTDHSEHSYALVYLKEEVGDDALASIDDGKQQSATYEQAASEQQVIIQLPIPKVVRNKSVLCKPFTQTKATFCRPHTLDVQCQTDECVREKPLVMPVPVPVYLPTPLSLYSAPTPTPIFIPIPIPVPVFIPTTRRSADGIMKHIKEIIEKTPSDPLEAELLVMAAAASGEGNTSNVDSETEVDTLPQINTSRKRPLSMVDDDEADDVSPLTSQKEDGVEDMLSMALRMAEELTDLEADMEVMPVATDTSSMADSIQVIPQHVPEDGEYRLRKSTRQASRGVGRPKRQRMQKTAGEEQQMMLTPKPQEPAVPPPDLNYHLKFTYGVNAWRHWVMFKNTQIAQTCKQESGGRVKLFKTDILQYTAEELNFSLCLFVKEVRKPNGDEYSPDSVYYLTLGLQLFLYENGRINNIFADSYYEPFQRRLTEILVTCQPKFNSAGQMVCRIEEEHLWECKQLGAHSPYVLLNTLIYFHTKYFMLKTPEDHLKLSFAQILKYWKKGTSPTKGGQAPRSVSLRYYNVRKDVSAMVSTKKRGSREGVPVFEMVDNQDNPLRCPVKLYEFFLSKCPESIKSRTDIFYPVPERSYIPDSPVWYSTQPLGEDVMTRMLTRILLVREIQEAHLHARPIYV